MVVSLKTESEQFPTLFTMDHDLGLNAVVSDMHCQLDYLYWMRSQICRHIMYLYFDVW